MTHEQILDYCLQKPGAYVDHPFGPDGTTIKVCGRIFAQLFRLKGEPMATFNCDALEGAFFRTQYPDHVTRGYHCPPIQQPYFNTVLLDGTVPRNVLLGMIDHAYRRVTSRLPKSKREALHAQKA